MQEKTIKIGFIISFIALSFLLGIFDLRANSFVSTAEKSCTIDYSNYTNHSLCPCGEFNNTFSKNFSNIDMGIYQISNIK